MFAWLDNYDMGLVLEPTTLKDAQDTLMGDTSAAVRWAALNDYNTGVVLYDQNVRTQTFLNTWNDLLLSQGEAFQEGAFQKELERSDVRLKQLPTEYNLMVRPDTHAVYLTSKVRCAAQSALLSVSPASPRPPFHPLCASFRRWGSSPTSVAYSIYTKNVGRMRHRY